MELECSTIRLRFKNNHFDRKVAQSKPAPDIFLVVAEQVGVAIDETIGIEDAHAGVQAMKVAGSLPIGAGRSEDLVDDIALVSSTSFLALDYLQKCFLGDTLKHHHG